MAFKEFTKSDIAPPQSGARTRFAPSPTGYLHVGNARTALLCYLFAKKCNAEFFLRSDDTDLDRSKEEFDEAIQEDLKWLGLSWDSYFRQSNRRDRYNSAKEYLISIGRLYPCYETKEEIELQRKVLLSRNLPPKYDRRALKLTEKDKANLESKGLTPHWRFLVKKPKIVISDMIRGDVEFLAENLSDPVLFKEDGSMTYMLASVVDDLDYSISHIIRGEDHIANTAIQIDIFEALGAQKIPKFAHLGLLQSKEHEISKRVGGFDLKSLRKEGFQPIAVSSFLSRLGTSDSVSLANSMDELIDCFSISKIGRSNVHYDRNEMLRLNVQALHRMKYDDMKKCMTDISDNEAKDKNNYSMSEDEWIVIRENISSLNDIPKWVCILRDINYIPDLSQSLNHEDISFITEVMQQLEVNDFSSCEGLHEKLKKIESLSFRKGKKFYLPLRLAITGLEKGPDMKDLLRLIDNRILFTRLNAIK